MNELVEPFNLAQPTISKHIKVLERAGLITRSRAAQTRPCRLAARPLRNAAGWIDKYRRFFDESFDRLEATLEQLQKGKADADR